MAAAHSEAVLRQRVCAGKQCRAVFFICAHCDRGHRYCSARCRQQTRIQQRRSANARHQRSAEGRLDHRDRQQQYRCRRRTQLGVTDQGSLSIASPASFECGQNDEPVLEAAPPESGSSADSPGRWPETKSGPWLRCRICGRFGRFIDPFPRIPHRR
jgi:hypothetical protein